jgi:hypothetical protein
VNQEMKLAAMMKCFHVTKASDDINKTKALICTSEGSLPVQVAKVGNLFDFLSVIPCHLLMVAIDLLKDQVY